MAEYLIQDTTMTEMANQMRRISGTTDALSGAEIAEMFSRTQGTVKTDGAYNVRAIDAFGSTIKDGMYDTGEIFALPRIQPDLVNLFTQSDGTTEWKTIATFDGWTGTSPVGYGYIEVDDAHIDIGALYKPVNNDLMLIAEITEENTTVNLNLGLHGGAVINWGDGASDILSSYTHTHTYNDAGTYLITIPYIEGAQYDFVAANYTSTTPVITMVFIPSWCSGERGLRNWLDIDSIKYILFANGAEAKADISYPLILPNSLEYIIFPNSMLSARMVNCSNTNIKGAVLPYGITTIPSFQNCSQLIDLIIPYGVTSIGNYAFSDCTALTSIHIPDSVTSIGAGAFRGANNLSEITGLKNVASIGDYAFDANMPLTELVLPSVISIGENAFNSLYKLQSIVLSANSVCEYTGTYNGISSLFGSAPTIYVPDSLVDSYKADVNWNTYASRIKPLSAYNS